MSGELELASRLRERASIIRDIGYEGCEADSRLMLDAANAIFRDEYIGVDPCPNCGGRAVHFPMCPDSKYTPDGRRKDLVERERRLAREEAERNAFEE